MTTAVIVQARMGSSRLPGKVLMDIGGRTVLEEVLRRCKAIEGVDVVVCATTDLAEDDAIVDAAGKVEGVVLSRGAVHDVLRRYRCAADQVLADIILRVTSDCPLIDPGLCQEVLSLRAAERADYAANNMPPGFPHGLDCEAFTVDLLRRADDEATEAYDREHVTPWMRSHSEVRKVNLRGPGNPVAEMRWTLDYQEDLEFMRAAFALLPSPPSIVGWQQFAESVSREVDEINLSRRVVRT